MSERNDIPGISRDTDVAADHGFDGLDTAGLASSLIMSGRSSRIAAYTCVSCDGIFNLLPSVARSSMRDMGMFVCDECADHQQQVSVKDAKVPSVKANVGAKSKVRPPEGPSCTVQISDRKQSSGSRISTVKSSKPSTKRKTVVKPRAKLDVFGLISRPQTQGSPGVIDELISASNFGALWKATNRKNINAESDKNTSEENEDSDDDTEGDCGEKDDNASLPPTGAHLQSARKRPRKPQKPRSLDFAVWSLSCKESAFS
jgi:hypothetical protein